MNADQVLELIQTMEPVEIERLFDLIKEFESKVRQRQAGAKPGGDRREFESIADRVFSENRGLFQKLAEFERNEREAQPPNVT